MILLCKGDQQVFCWHAQVLNVDNSTASPSVLLVLDNKRYLFNAGEGIQRHFIEYKQKMRQITSVMATRVSTDTLAGLPGTAVQMSAAAGLLLLLWHNRSCSAQLLVASNMWFSTRCSFC
jgi:ribonuclease BN (tRNA processing enzyme)